MALGSGDAVFQRAVDGLRDWQAHLRAGVDVATSGARLSSGLVVALAVRVPPLYVTVACRIVSVIEHPTCFGFIYGTLPHHVIEGEERFLVEHEESDAVRFTVTAFLRARGRAMRSMAPVVHLLDQRMVRRYLAGMQQHVSG